jgi:mxaJ protein
VEREFFEKSRAQQAEFAQALSPAKWRVMTVSSLASRARRFCLPVLSGAAFCLSSGLVSAAPAAAPVTTGGDILRVCAANQPPYSIKGGGGFENKIALAVADAMGRQVQFIWSSRPAIYLVQEYLNKKLCDVIIGLDTSDPRVLATKPYYRAGYVFVTRTADHLDIHSWGDPRLLKFDHIAVGFYTPGEEMLKKIGKYDDDFNYEKSLVNFRSARNEYIQVDPARMVGEVASGNAQIAAAFAPEVARLVRESSAPLTMTPVDDDTVNADGQKVPQTFDQSMGVRKDDAALGAQLNAALVKAAPDIDAILKDEGIPLLKPHS